MRKTRPPRGQRIGTIGLSALSALLFVPAAIVAQDPEEEGDHVRRRFEYFYEQRAYPFAEIPTGALQRALAELRLRFPVQSTPGGAAAPGFAAATVEDPVWSPLGPELINGADAGRTSTIALHPTDPNIIYIGGAQGGVWRTTDGGGTWVPLTDSECSLAMGHIAIDPVTPEIIYAGTGELHFSGDSYYGCGILRSTDGGSTWTHLGASIFDTNTGGARISKIVIDPTTAGTATQTTVYAATSFGLFRSMDSGETWTRIMEGIITDLIQDPIDLAVMYVALSTTAARSENGVYKTEDGGETWNRLSTGFATTDIGRVQIAMSALDPGVLYASVQNGFDDGNSDGELLGIWYTNNGGQTWMQLPATNASCGTQCWYNHVITVHPTDPGTVYFGGVNLYKSVDGGFNFSNIRRNIHVDQHAIVIDPGNPERVYVGNDGGVFRTEDGGGTWTSLNANLSVTQFYPGIALHPTNPNTMLGGTQDNGTVQFDGVPSWDRVLGADGGYTAIDFLSPQTAYAETQWSSGSGFGGPRRRDGFGSFERRVAGIDVNDRALFIPPLVMDPTDPQVLYFGTYRVYRTANRAETWTAISGDLNRTANGRISAIGPSASDPQTVYVGTSDGNLQVTNNGGTSWNLRRNGLPDRFVTDVIVSPIDPDIAWLSVSGFGTGHVFRTENGGSTWQDASGDLPDVPVNAVLAPTLLAGEVYIGTDLGVFRSTDDGATWAPLQVGMPNVAIFDLAYGPTTGRLVAATHGRGTFAFSPIAAASVTIDSDSLHFMAFADTARLDAAATSPDGEPLPNPPVAWLSLDPTVASVDANGLVRSVGNGVTQVVAALAGAADTVPVVVRQVVTDILGLTTRDSLVIGETRLLNGRAVDPNGQTVADAITMWTTSDPTSVSVDEAGRIEALDVGSSFVVLAVETFRDSTLVRVEDAAVLAVSAQPLPPGEPPYSASESRFALLALDLEVMGIEPIRLTRLAFDVEGDDPEARIELIRDEDRDGRIGEGDVTLRTLPVALQPGPSMRVTITPSLTVPAVDAMRILVGLRMSGLAPNGATFSATFQPSETKSVGTRSDAEDRLQLQGSPVASEDILTTVLEGDAPFGMSENPVRLPTVSFNFAVGSNVTRANVFTVTGRPVADLMRLLTGAAIEWDMTNDSGGRVQPGVYLIVFEIDGTLYREKLVIIRRDDDGAAPGEGGGSARSGGSD